MTSGVSELDDRLAELEIVSGKPASVWLDTLTLPEPIRTETIRERLEDDWVRLPDRLAQALAILELAETVAGAVSGFAGAAGAVRAAFAGSGG